jgi:serine/threonine protein kinase
MNRLGTIVKMLILDMRETHPNFTNFQYQIQRELGRNREGGRISYLAQRLDKEGELAVIKQFRFVQTDANWQGFKTYEREIQFLRELDHPRIPRYLDSFETGDGFCMVQEYKAAPTLSDRRTFKPIEIKKIALSVLEILVDLQQRVPPIFHRDIKPENILVDEECRAYLIDFGLARIDRQEVAVSSMVAGTPGFMAPEELFNRPLSKASDLYSLGATIICLVTNTRSIDISNLLNDNYCLKFEHLVTGVNPLFIKWLQKTIAPNPRDRFPDAATAKLQLESIDIENTKYVISPVKIPYLKQVPIETDLKSSQPLFILGGAALIFGVGALFFSHNSSQQFSNTTNIAATPNTLTGNGWFDRIKPRCNAVEAATAIASSPPPNDWQGMGYAAACYALAGRIDLADSAIGRLDPALRHEAVHIVFEIGHPVADAGDDRSAGPIMELVLKYYPENYMAMYHAGMSAYALGNIPLSKQRLTDFLNTYTVTDGWTNNARTVMDKIDRGINNGSYPKDP